MSSFLTPSFTPSPSTPEPPSIHRLLSTLSLQPHPEGGYFAETDRAPTHIPDPFRPNTPSTRAASTTIFYYLSPSSPLGVFHRNRGRTVHTLHKGRGRYVVVHADEVAGEGLYGPGGEEGAKGEGERWRGKARVETFVVGQGVEKGERLQWIVEGGKYKSSFLLPDEEGGSGSEGLLISETVVPGFEYEDHDFMRRERMEALLTEEQVKEMEWMLRKDA